MFFRQIKFLLVRNLGNRVNGFALFSDVSKRNFSQVFRQHSLKESKLNFCSSPKFSTVSLKSTGIHDTISSINVKKRVVRKKKTLEDEVPKPGIYNVVAFATAEEYNLENLIKGLKVQDLYEPKNFENSSDIIHATAKYPVEREPRDIFFFRDGK